MAWKLPLAFALSPSSKDSSFTVPEVAKTGAPRPKKVTAPIIEGLTLVTHDRRVEPYEVSVLWT